MKDPEAREEPGPESGSLQETCRRFDEALSEILGLDGEEGGLPPAERDLLLRHADACPRCAGARKAYAATVDLLRALPAKRAPPDFLSWVREDLGSPAAARLPRRDRDHRTLRKGWLALAALIPIAVALGFFWIGPVRSPPPEIVRAPVPSSDASTPGARGETLRIGESRSPQPPQSRRLALRDGDRVPAAAAASPRADEAVAAVAAEIAFEVPFRPGAWEKDLESLETELRGRFHVPARTEPPAAAEEAARGFAFDRAETEATQLSVKAQEEDAPPAGEIALSVDPGKLAALRLHLDEWARSRGGEGLDTLKKAASPEKPGQTEERGKLEASKPAPPVGVKVIIRPSRG